MVRNFTGEEAERLLAPSRQARWALPSSVGRGLTMKLAANLLAHAQSVLEEAGIDPALDDEFEIDWLRRQLADESQVG